MFLLQLLLTILLIPMIFTLLDISINGFKNGGENLWLAIPFKKIKKDLNNNYLD